jgi:hypothetical protein
MRPRKCGTLVLRTTYTNAIPTGRAYGQLGIPLVNRPEMQGRQRSTAAN